MVDGLTLGVEGTLYAGWQSIAMTRSIEQMVNTFSVGFAERWYEDSKPIPINDGDPVIIELDRDEVLVGFVDDSEVSYDASSHGATVTGRSKTGDLVDCAAIHKSGEWKRSTIKKIAQDLCTPFDINVRLRGSEGAPFRKFAIQDGETVHEALERGARMRGLMLLTNTKGDLFLTRAGTRKVNTVIKRGVNVLTGARRGSMRDRFSKYIGKAQIPGDDKQSGDDITIKRSVEDKRVRRYRPTIIMAENEDTGKELKDRVVWERNRRSGDARRAIYTVQGWRDDDFRLWEPNTLVDVDDPLLRIRGELLIVSVKYQRGNDGTTTELELSRKEAFELIEFPPPKPKTTGEDFLA